jgi:hypothetical protein
MNKIMTIRIPIMACVILALFGALWAALMRLGWQMPPLPVPLAGQHGALIISGFLGTLICLERAVALRHKWTYAAPLLSGLGGLALLFNLPPEFGRGLITLASLGLVVVFAYSLRIRSSVDVVTMTLGSVLWLIGNLLWLANQPIPYAAPWWAGFLIMTIAGERLELSRVLMLKPASRTIFKIAVAVFTLGLVLSLFAFDLGLKVGGLGLILLGGWLLRYDIARHTIKKTGLTRYIAACLLPGYVWLIVGGALWVLYGGQAFAGPLYDALLHSLFLGFVFSMIFGHAPIIVPAVVPIDITYHWRFYIPLVLLQASLVVRILADLMLNQPLRMWAGLFNVLAILIFLGNLILSARRRK